MGGFGRWSFPSWVSARFQETLAVSFREDLFIVSWNLKQPYMKLLFQLDDSKSLENIFFNQNNQFETGNWNQKNSKLKLVQSSSINLHCFREMVGYLHHFHPFVLGGALIVLNRIRQRSVSGNGASYLKDYGNSLIPSVDIGIFTYMKTHKNLPFM